ncbi:hypothetical protein [Acinetobacter modestus]|uniref:hypothetical protein n=1 Tax=Acinetobacter modestus TaxID=1776740 RepID=UPI001F4B7A8A|nr:hypothetical protein [Acinetobacter modestus]MCH7331922.1 hypothetical protein [Acinetobacter modestus]
MKKIILCSLILGLIGCAKKDIPKETSDQTSQVASMATTDEQEVKTANELPPESTSKWTYDESSDEMRGIKSKFAVIESDNQVNFNFPYDGGSNLRITLRQKTNEPTEVMFVIDKGQYSCDTISDNCFASVKFDNQVIKEIELDGTTDYSSDVLFIKSSKDSESFIHDISKSKALIIELPFYQEGNKQFKFSPSGLEWVSKKSKSSIKSEAIIEATDDAVAEAANAIDAAVKTADEAAQAGK